MNMSLQKINKKAFKSPFNNPRKHSPSDPERKISFQEHEARIQCQVMAKAPPLIGAKKPDIKKNGTNNSRTLKKDLNKEEKGETKKLSMTSLTDTEYDEIFSSAINRALTGGIPSPIMEYNTGNSDDEVEIENRAAVPEPNEAQSPQELAEGPMEYIRTEVQEKKAFSREGKAAQPINCNAYVPEITPTKDSFNSKKTNFEDIQGITKEKKVLLSTKKPNLPFLPVLPKNLVQDQMDESNQEHYRKHTNENQNLKTACEDTESVPKMKKMQVNQVPKPQNNSSLQKSTFKKHKEIRVKDSSQLSQSSSLQNQSDGLSKHSTQCSHHSQECGHVCKKKHSHDCSNLTQHNNIHQDSIIPKSGSQTQCSQTVLSQPGPELSLKERLLWLQKRRDVGLWVQCSRPICNKWRFLHDIRDPVDVRQEWFCHMNSDKKYNSCAVPEKPPTPLEEEDLIHNMYTAGSVVWGRLAGFPWWPAMVDDDPDTEQYYWLNSFSDIPTHYNVVFFDEKDVTRAWLTPGAMRPFTGYENSKEFRKTTARGIDYAKRLQAARLQAQKALPMGTGERLRTFGFLARFKGSIGSIKKKKQQDRRKPAEDEETFPQNSDEDEALVVHRDLQEEKDKQKPKRKRAKKDSILQPAVKKTKVQAADSEEKKRSSEAINKIPRMNSNKVQENSASKRPNQTTFSSSLYTQELSNKEIENSKEKPFAGGKSKTLQFESNTEESLKGSARQAEAASTRTKSVNLSLLECKQPSTSNERKKITDEMQILSDDESETQFSVASKRGKDIMNCSQDLFSSQNGTTEQNTSQKKNADTNDGTITVIGSSTSDGLNSRNMYAPHEENKANEITIDSCKATAGEATEPQQIKTTNSIMRMLEENTSNMMECGGAVNDNEPAVRGIVSSTQSVLQPDISNQSTSSAPTGSYLNCSDSVPLVPNSQCNTVHTETNRLVHQNGDAVVPQLSFEDSDNSYDSVDFEAEE